MKKSIHCLRVGQHQSRHGSTLDVTPEILSEIVESFDWSIYRPPLTEGHPNSNNGIKACGWVKSLRLSNQGTDLWADVELNEYGAQLVADNQYKNVSIGLRTPLDDTSAFPGKYSMDHLALVLIPAIKGLAEFSQKIKDNQDNNILSIEMKKIKETEQDNIKETDELVDETTEMSAESATDSSEILEETEELMENKEELMENKEEPMEDKAELMENKEELMEDEVENEAMAIVLKELEQKSALEKQVAQLQEQIAAMKKAQMSEQIATFAEKLYADGKFSPAHLAKSDIVAFAEKLTSEPTPHGKYEFCDGVSMLDQFMTMMNSVPTQVSYTEQMPATQQTDSAEEKIEYASEMNGLKADPQSMDVFVKAMNKSKKEQISFEQALKSML